MVRYLFPVVLTQTSNPQPLNVLLLQPRPEYDSINNLCFLVDRLLYVINAIKEEIVVRVEDASPRPTNMTDTLERLIQETLGEN